MRHFLSEQRERLPQVMGRTPKGWGAAGTGWKLCRFGSQWNWGSIDLLHPWNLTWKLKRSPWKRRFLLETIIFRFHVKFRGCTRNFNPKVYQPENPDRGLMIWDRFILQIWPSANSILSGWWFQISFISTPNLGEMIQFDEYFSDGWFNHQLVYFPRKLSLTIAGKSATNESMYFLLNMVDFHLSFQDGNRSTFPKGSPMGWESSWGIFIGLENIFSHRL